MPDQAELHRRAVEEFGARVRAVADDQTVLLAAFGRTA